MSNPLIDALRTCQLNGWLPTEPDVLPRLIALKVQVAKGQHSEWAGDPHLEFARYLVQTGRIGRDDRSPAR